MSTDRGDCGVCLSASSKYKCPTCSIKYCSLGCYRSHRKVHAEQPDQTPTKATAPTATTTIIPPAPSTLEASTPRSRPGGKKPDFTNFESDAVLTDLLRKYPGLRIQLQSVYGQTLEPASSNTGRGRGIRGGGNWSPAKGQAEAVERLARLRAEEGDDGGVAEFIRLVGLRFDGEG